MKNILVRMGLFSSKLRGFLRETMRIERAPSYLRQRLLLVKRSSDCD